jgi:hypothetical protein
MQNNTENSPLIPPVKQGRSLEYAAEIEVFRSEISKSGLSSPNEIIDDGRIHRFSSSYCQKWCLSEKSSGNPDFWNHLDFI